MAIYCKHCNKKVYRASLAGYHLSKCELFGEGAEKEISRMQKSPLVIWEHFLTEFQRPVDRYQRQKDSIYDGMFSDYVRPSVQEDLCRILHDKAELDKFEFENFNNRLAISGVVADGSIYYRKMAQEELNKVQLAWGKRNVFEPTFEHMNTRNYRYWVSSSLEKVQVFGNENAVGDGNRIVRFIFNQSVWGQFKSKIEAHQKKGVQSKPELVAVHREGFAEIGAVDCDDDVKEIAGPPALDHNLGFTSNQAKELQHILLRCEVLL